MKIIIILLTILSISIIGCGGGGGSGGSTSSFDATGTAPIIEGTETNSTNVDSLNNFKIVGNINEEVFTLKATDRSDMTYYLTGKDGIRFYIDPIIGKVFFRGKKEYDDTSSFFISVVVKDALGNVSSKDYRIDLIEGGHVNDKIPPNFVFLQKSYNLDDEFRNRIEIEAEDRNPIYFSLQDESHNFILTQNGNLASIHLVNTPIEKDFVSTIKVSVTDIYGNQSSKEITLNVEKITTEQPSIIFSSANEFTMEENSLTKHLIKTNLKPFFADRYSPSKYALYGEAAKYFELSYELKNITDPFSEVKETYLGLLIPADYEAKKEYSLILVAGEEEQGRSSQHITIKVSDRNEENKDTQKPIFIGEEQYIAYGEFYSDYKYLTSVSASDDNAIKYSLREEDDTNNLVINPNSGEIYVAEHMWGNLKNEYNFTVIATDTQGNAATEDIKVERYNVIVSPYTAPSYHNIETDGHIEIVSSTSKTVTTLKTTKSVENFSLTGEDKDDFTLDSETGLLKFKDIPNYFIKSFYKISVNGKVMFITVKKP